ncbi:MAG: NAD(P)-dependent oxidoreductase [Gemmatimonadota bacterium]|nr:NAD(P)-dependent oxidoreductase [Gemmatimonadota bacterium]
MLPQTQHFIGERELKLMKKNAFLINTARGPIIDEAALTTTLQEGWLIGCRARFV